jgi:hypothetical protein
MEAAQLQGKTQFGNPGARARAVPSVEESPRPVSRGFHSMSSVDHGVAAVRPIRKSSAIWWAEAAVR